MKVPVKTGGTSGEQREVFPKGSYPAVVVGLVDLGTHTQQKYQSTEYYERRTVFVVFELVTKTLSGTKDVRPTLGLEYTLSMDRKAKLRSLAESILGEIDDGEDFDPATLLGKPCIVALTIGKSAKGNQFNRVDNVAAPMDGVITPPPQNTPFAWWLDDGTDYDPPWQLPYVFGVNARERIETSHEWQQRNGTPQKPPQANATPRSAPPPARNPNVTQTPGYVAPPPPVGTPTGRWVVWDGVEQRELSHAEVQELIDGGADPAALQVRTPNSSQWRIASEAGFKTSIPF